MVTVLFVGKVAGESEDEDENDNTELTADTEIPATGKPGR
jgi:hypothetical protein